jgi:putative membrane-bound dehydrogenase-like protein
MRLSLFLIVILSAPAGAADAPLSPDQARRAFQLPSDLTIELVVGEPAIYDPVDMAFDEHGRLFVVEMRDYATGPAAGRIALLTDNDGDGCFTRRSTFVDDLAFPTGVLYGRGGIFVTCAPDILFFKDTDNDGVADERRVLFTGFAEKNTQLRVNHPRIGLDNWIHVANGLRGGAIAAPDRPEVKPIPIPRSDFRFTPDGSRFEAAAGFGQFGLTFDDHGQRFVCSNRNPIKHVVLETRHLGHNPQYAYSQTEADLPEGGIPTKVYAISDAITTATSHAGTFTSACGLEVYRGDLLPAAYRGHVFICEPTGNLVQRNALVPHGPSFIARRTRPEIEFLATTDTWFRPVNIANGPDGGLYVVDMVRKEIEHPEWLAEAVRRRTDFESGKDHGRIWRIRPKDTPRRPTRWPSEMNTTELIATLGHPNGWHRATAQRLLVERNDPVAIESLKQAVRSAPSPLARPPLARLHALYTLDGLGHADATVLETALADADPACRYHAVRLSENHLNSNASLLARVLSLSRDDDPRVRFETALALGGVADARVVPALARIITRDVAFEWTRVAVLAALNARAGELLTNLVRQQPAFVEQDDASHADVLSELGAIAAAQCDDATTRSFIDSATASDTRFSAASAMALIDGLATGLRRRAAGRTALGKLTGRHAPLDRLLTTASKLAADRDASLTRRLTAIRLLTHSTFELAGTTLLDLTGHREPSAVQLAAVTALTQLDDPRMARMLVDPARWYGFTPAVRTEALTALLARPDRVAVLLDAVEAEAVPPLSIDPARRKQLLEHRDPKLRERAVALFADLQPVDRKKVFESYRPILELPADGTRGKPVFLKHCGICHQLENQGTAVGPDLYSLRNQAKESLLMHILMPNQTVDPAYTNYVVRTTDGDILTGVIASESPTSVTLRRGQGVEDTILRANITEMYSSNVSIMPQELEQNVTRQELADLLEYLKNGTPR